ncbi:UNVERIFIED_CONTAM: hypothetical protein HDU68_012662 [Siphonaria sp. JEL0065]|nr:hypothetical protein HDU68_012662 [Siphonaria sp. JEL0065]
MSLSHSWSPHDHLRGLQASSVNSKEKNLADWLVWLATESNAKYLPSPYHDLDSDQTERAILFEAVPKMDPFCTTIDAAPVRALLMIHMALGEGLGRTTFRGTKLGGENKGGEIREVALRSEKLDEIISLPGEMLLWMQENKGVPMPVRSKPTSKLAIERPTKDQIQQHIEKMRDFFKEYVLDDIALFNRLRDMNEHIQKALCDVMSSLHEETCLGCMNYRLQQSFSKRIDEYTLKSAAASFNDPQQQQVIPKKQNLILTNDEILCLNTLRFAIPQNIEGLKPMLPYIAARMDSGDPSDEHSLACRQLFEHRAALYEMCHLMWEICPGSISFMNAGGKDEIGELDVYDNTKVKDIDTSFAHEYQARQDRENLEKVLDNDSDSEQEDENLGLVEKSSQARAHDILLSRTREPLESILKMSPLDWVWTVQLGDRAVTIFRRMRNKNMTAFVPVMKNIAMIANGFWTKSVACSLVADTKVVLYESKVLNNLRIVWQVEIAYSEINRLYSQVIRIQSIGNHKDVVDAVEYIQAAHKAYSPVHVGRCKERSSDLSGVVTPITWPDDGEEKDPEKEFKVTFDFENANDPLYVLKMHEQAVTAKFIPLSKMMLCWLISDQKDKEDAEFPFSISEQEHKILQHTNSVIVVGRSGTGKTSCSVFRLLSHWHARMVDFNAHKFISNQIGINPSIFAVETEDKPNAKGRKKKLKFRQLFVTASPKFCSRVQRYYRNLSKSLNPGGNQQVLADLIDQMNLCCDLSQEALDNANEIGGVRDENGELLSFEKELSSPAYGGEVPRQNSSNYNFDGEEEYIQNLPKSFGDLKESDFPLFIHYKKFLSMIRVYLGLEEDVSLAEGDFAERNADYERFEEIYKSLDKKLTSGVEVSLAFTEIMGVIKGNEKATLNLDGKLLREEYLNLSTRAYASFKNLRPRIYDIFEAYNAKKLERFQLYINGKQEFVQIPRKLDEQDRVNEVNRAVAEMIAEKDARLAKLMVHQVFLDEVQDLTMAQIMPLVTLCSDPEHGLMFAGDTAQVIHRGSVFRFQDLSSMIYNTLKPSKAITSAPKIFKLTKNYRSHDGILQVAACVLKLLKTRFENMIDELGEEKGAIPGPQPVLVLQNNNNTKSITSFLKGGKTDGEPIEFGAGQVILVRTLENVAEVKRELKQDYALVMTVEQAKGMEFRDVVLMNLIGNSPASPQHWRVFLDHVKVPEGVTKEKGPTFDEQKHNILATELKILYTAITRARSRLWFWEDNEDARGPMFKVWESWKLVVTSDDERSGKFSAMGAESTPEEWYAQGKTLFESQQYDDALQAFRKGLRAEGKPDASFDTLRCEAFLKRDAAKAGKTAEAKKLFFEAAELFKRANSMRALSQNHILEAARCYMDSEESLKAAEMFDLMTHKPMEAVSCFQKVARFDLSGAALVALNKHKEALQDFVRAPRCSLEALKTAKVLFSRNETPDLATIEKVSTMALANHRLSKREKVDAIEINPDIGVKKGLYRAHAMYSELANVFAGQKDFEGAAKVMDLDAGKPLEAVRFFKEISPPTGNIMSLDSLLRFFWNHITPGLEAIFQDDLNTIRSLLSTHEFGSSGLILKTLPPIIGLKGKLSGSDAATVQNKWVEIQAIVQFTNTKRALPPLAESKDLCEMLLALKLTLASQLISLKENQKVKAGDDVKATLEVVETFLQLILVFRTLMAGLNNNAELPVSPLDFADTPVFSRISDLSKIGIRDALCGQVERAFYISAGNISTQRICYKGLFERNSLILAEEKSLHTDSAGRYHCDVEVFYSLARSSISYTVFNMSQSIVITALESLGLGSMCLQGVFSGGKCSSNSCPYGHLVTSAEFDKRKSSLLNYLVRLVVTAASFVPLSKKVSFDRIRSLVINRFISSLEPWDEGHCWTLDLEERSIPGDVMQAVCNQLRNVTLNIKELTNRSGGFNLDAILGGCMIVASHGQVDFLKSNMNRACEMLSEVSSGISHKFVSNILFCINQCINATNVVDFLAAAIEILKESIKIGTGFFKLTNGDALCGLIEVITVIFLLARQSPFVLPWRIFIAGVTKFDTLLKTPIDLGVLKHYDTVSSLLSNVVSAIRIANVHESKLLRLAYTRMLFIQHEYKESPKRDGVPGWLTAPTFMKLLEKISNVGNNQLVFIYRDPLKLTEFVKTAVEVSRKSLQLNVGETRTLPMLKGALKNMNEKFLLGMAQNAAPSPKKPASVSKTPASSSSRAKSKDPAKKSVKDEANDSMPELMSDSDEFSSDNQAKKKSNKSLDALKEDNSDLVSLEEFDDGGSKKKRSASKKTKKFPAKKPVDSDSDSNIPTTVKKGNASKPASASASKKSPVVENSDSDEPPPLMSSSDDDIPAPNTTTTKKGSIAKPPPVSKPVASSYSKPPATNPTAPSSRATTAAKSSPKKTMSSAAADLLDSSNNDVPARAKKPGQPPKKPDLNPKTPTPSSSTKLKQPTTNLDYGVEADVKINLDNIKAVPLIIKSAISSVVKQMAPPTIAKKVAAANKIRSWYKNCKQNQSRTTSSRSTNRMPRIYSVIRLWSKSKKPYTDVYIWEAVPVYLGLLDFFPDLDYLCQIHLGTSMSEADTKLYYEAIQLREVTIRGLSALDPSGSHHHTHTVEKLKESIREHTSAMESVKRVLAVAPKSVLAKAPSDVGNSSEALAASTGRPGSRGNTPTPTSPKSDARNLKPPQARTAATNRRRGRR